MKVGNILSWLFYFGRTRKNRNLQIMPKLFIIHCSLFILLVSHVYAETASDALQKKVEDAIRAEQSSQKQADTWADERARLLNEIRDMKTMSRWLKHQKTKYETYIRKQEKTLQELERRKAETQRMKMSLEPFLDDTFVRLKDFVEQDLPFLPEERQKRLGFLKDALDDYHLGLPEKTKRLLEALQVEAGYGETIERTEATIDMENGPTQVSILRLGRVAMFYLSPDGWHVGWFDPQKKAWTPLPSDHAREISRALEIAEKKRTPVLLDLPIGRPQP